MFTFISIIFWGSAFLIVYTWIIYPLCLYLLNKVREAFKSPARSNICYTEELKTVSVVIAAYNEEKVIAGRIENILEQHYPPDRVEIVIASDGSRDRTTEIALRYGARGVKVLDFKNNRGKAPVMNDAVSAARNEILIFTDADTIFDKYFLVSAVRQFSNQSVGCVVGKLKYIEGCKNGVASSEGKYFKYEVKIRGLESSLGILAAASGAAFCCRRDLYVPIRNNEDADVILPLATIVKGRFTVFAPDAVAYDLPPSSVKDELRYRFRDSSLSLAGTLRIISQNLLKIIRKPLLLWGIISHRFLRWFNPVFLLLILISNIYLLFYGKFYLAIFAMQLFFYFIGLIGLVFKSARNNNIVVSMVFSYIVANTGMFWGLIRFCAGKASSSWEN